MRTALALMLSFGLTSCWLSDSTQSFTERVVGSPDNVVNITSDTVLDRDYQGTQFVVSNGATLFASNYVLSGLNNNDESFGVVELRDGNLNGGNIKYANGGAILRPVGLPVNWKLVLEGLPQVDRIPYLNQLRAGLTNHCQKITGTKFYQNRNHIYITSLNPCADITNIEINRGRLGIYHDFSSLNTVVKDSLFTHVGKDYYSDKVTNGLFKYPSARENVAIDGSSFNEYSNNTFIYGARSAINLYVNCGETDSNGNATPREEPALNNNFINNTFEKFTLGIWNSSRAIDRVTTPCRADDQGDRVINTFFSQNTFIDVIEEIKNGGT